MAGYAGGIAVVVDGEVGSEDCGSRPLAIAVVPPQGDAVAAAVAAMADAAVGSPRE